MQEIVVQRQISTGLDDQAVPDCSDDELGCRLQGVTSQGEPPRSRFDMHSEEARLQTFGQNWSLQWAEQFAHFGFYCVNAPGNGKRCVRCAFCGLEIIYFSSPSDVKNQHRQAACTYCPNLIDSGVADNQISSSEMNAVSHPGGNICLNSRDEDGCGTGKHFPRSPDPKGHTQATGSSNRCCASETKPVRTENLKLVGATPIFSSPLNASHSVPSAGLTIPAFPPNSVTCDLQQPRSDPTQVLSSNHPQAHHQHPPPPQAQSWSAFHHGNRNHETQRPSSYPPSSTPTPVRRPLSEHKQERPMTWDYIMRSSRYPQMASFQARLDSLEKTWPLPRPTPRELAKAGLFHVPSGVTHNAGTSGYVDTQCRLHHHSSPSASHVIWADSVKCFWCGERLNQWQDSDDAVLEHARLSPGCRYIIQILGQQLHDDVIKASNHANNSRYYTTKHQQPPVRPQRSSQPPAPQHPPQPQTSSKQIDVDQAMEWTSVKAVLRMGFPRHLIRELLSECDLESPLLNADYLCDLALQATRASDEKLSGTMTSSTPAEKGLRTPSSQAWTKERIAGEETVSAVNANTTAIAKHDKENFNVNGEERIVPSAPPLPPSEGLDSKVKCKVCSEAEVKVTFRPCNHRVCCSSCAFYFTSCPVCDVPVNETLTRYLA